MKWLKVFAVAAVLLGVAASASGDSNTYNYQGSGPYFNPKSGQRVDASGNAQVVDADRDRDLDYYATAINAVAPDTGSITLSATLDLRGYTNAVLHIHMVPSATAADTGWASTHDYGITVYTPPTQSIDWTGYGMSLPMFPNPANPKAVATGVDSLGFWGTSATPSNTMAGERIIRLRSHATNNAYANRALPNSAAIPLSYFLAPGMRPRFIVVQLRHVASSVYSKPNVRVDVEALR